jgi:O-antigen/teichoic acid export membrane protein
MQSLTNVAVSALSRLSNDANQYRRHLLSALSVAAFLGMGVGGNLTLVGKDVIRVLLGPGWEPAGRIFTFFGPGVGIMFLYGTHGWIHLSLGRADRWFRWGLMEFTFTGLLFVLGLPWGPAGVATSWSLSLWILTIPALWYAGKPINFGIAPVIAAVWRYILASLFAGLATAIIVGLPAFPVPSNSIGAIVRIAEISCLFGAMYISAVISLHQNCAPIYQVTALIREMLPSGRSSNQPAVVGTGA